ncbi:MAG TPA: hypothetical protein VGA95_09065 [Thermodesulfobacteriota bacterium]|jgi:hypothetical protein
MRFTNALKLSSVVFILGGCSGNPQGAGYWFHIIFILLPLIIIGVLLLRRIEGLHDSVFTMEGQLKRLSGKLDNIDEKIKQPTGKKEG